MKKGTLIPVFWKKGDALRDWAASRITTRQCLLDVRRELQARISEEEFSRELSRKLDAIEVLLEP